MSRALVQQDTDRAAHSPKGSTFPECPCTVSDHDLVRRVGRGSYGSIWLARTVTGIWRAVKVVERDRFEDARPFEREFDGVRRFEPLSREHPALVDILQTGRGEEGGHFYYVMELADDASQETADGSPVPVGSLDPSRYRARTLHGDLKRRGRLSPHETLDLGCRLAAGVGFLHAHGLIHRDIKPSNIIYAGGQAKLADIGLVTGASDARSFVGTEGYAAPEGPNSTRADIYSLGMVLYEAGMGRGWREFPEVADGVTQPQERRLLMELNAILLKACAADPARRYQDAGRMQADLEHVRRGGSVRRRHALGRWARRMMAGSAGVGILAAWVATGARWQASRHRPTPPTTAAWVGEFHKAQAHEMLRSGDASGAALNLVAAAHARGSRMDQSEQEPWPRVRRDHVLESMPRLTSVLHVGAGVASACFSPDGRRVAAADRRGSITVWDAYSGQREFGSMPTGTAPQRVRFSNDGRRILLDEDGQRQVLVAGQGSRPPAVAMDARSGTVEVQGPEGSRFGVFGPDNQFLASAMSDRTIIVQDANRGQVRFVLRGHEHRITGLTFSHDARRMASIDAEGWVRVWDMTRGEACAEPFRPPSDLGQVTFTPDGQRMAVVHTPGTFRPVLELWDLGARPARVSSVELTSSPVLAETVTLGGRALFLADEREGFAVRSLFGDAVVVPQPMAPLERSIRWALAPDGLLAATAHVDGMVRVWDLASGKPTLPALPHGGMAGALAFSADASQLVVGTDDGALKVWDLARPLPGPPPIQPREGIAFVPPENIPYPANVSSDGRWLATVAPHGGALRPLVIDLHSWSAEFLSRQGKPAKALSVNWGHLSAQFVTFDLPSGQGSRRPEVLRWSHDGRSWQAAQLPHPAVVAAVAFSHDDSILTTRDVLGTVRAWRNSNGALLHTASIPVHGSPWGTLAPTGERLLALEDGGLAVRFTDLMGRGADGRITLNSPYRHGRFSPDGLLFASLQADHSLRVFDAVGGREVFFSNPPSCHALTMDWSPEGRRLLVVDDKAVLHLFRVDGSLVHSRMGSGTFPVRRACFGKDGQCIAVADEQNAVHILDALTLAPWTLPFPHLGEVQHMVVTPSKQLVTFSDPDQIRRWDLQDRRLPVAVFEQAATVLSARQPRAGTTPESLPLPRLLSGHARLQADAPHLVRRAAEDLQAWRLQQGQSLQSLPHVEAAAAHLKHLADERPRAAAVAARHAQVAARLLPTRAPDTPPQCLDLSACLTHSPGMLPGGELSSLPVGHHVIDGTPFDLRGILRLEATNYYGNHRRSGRWLPASLPTSQARGIPVRRACHQLALLHGVSDLEEAPGREVARWRVHYQDGGTAEFPIRHGIEVSAWRCRATDIASAGALPPAWSARLPAPHDDTVSCLYKVVWTNPRPNEPVNRLDFLLPAGVQARPFVVAITIDP